MKQIIELNGVANIKMMLDINTEVNPTTGLKEVILYGSEVDKVMEQLKFLEKYMRAYNDAINKGEQTPFWHEVRDIK
jgi:tetrahydromethanopterin S-methyltransferase subunit B